MLLLHTHPLFLPPFSQRLEELEQFTDEVLSDWFVFGFGHNFPDKAIDRLSWLKVGKSWGAKSAMETSLRILCMSCSCVSGTRVKYPMI
jgi:hypothetical protein